MTNDALYFQIMTLEKCRVSSIPPGISRPCFGIGMVAKRGMFESKILSTAGRKEELYSSILPTSSMTNKSVSSLI